MLKGIGGAAFCLMVLSLISTVAAQDQPASRVTPDRYRFKGSTLDIISSSHQDIAWMNSPEACIEYRDAQCITPALEMMRQDKDYCFVMENMLNLMEYLERHPDLAEEIARFTGEGRLEWGATFNQPYESLLSGEQLVRETYFGRKWLKKTFPGADARVYFNPDVPGRALQMQQILSKAGIPYMVISRYHEGFYRWFSPDGSSVVAYSPGHYTNASSILGAAPEQAARALEEKLTTWAPYYIRSHLPPEFPLLHSVDFSRPTDFSPLLNLWNNKHAAGDGSGRSTMRYSSARRFFDALTKPGPDFDRIRGERPNLWLYIHGPTHHHAVSAQREAGLLLPAAEIFSTVSSVLEGNFRNYPVKEMEEAWTAAITPDHGWGGKEGQITDRLFRQRYERARDLGGKMLENAVAKIAARIKTPPFGRRAVIVFNSLSWKRTDPVTIEVDSSVQNWSVQDFLGNTLPSQVLPALPVTPKGRTRLEFIAPGVPPLGYKTFYLVEPPRAASNTPASPAPAAVYENAFYRIEFAPGGLKSVFDKELGSDILRTEKFLGFEVFTMRSVGNGAGEFGRVQQPSMEGFDKLSAHRTPWTYDPLESGILKVVFRLEQDLPNCTIEEKVTIYRNIKRIDCDVSLLDWDGAPYREFRLALPVNAPGGQVAYEVPMGVVVVGKSEIHGTGGKAYGTLNYDEPCSEIRPREVQNFLSASGPGFGLTMSTSVAVNDFEDPTSAIVPYPVLQPVLLASRRSCHGEGNWYLQEGDHHYHFALFSHAPGWENGYRLGIQANAPLVAVVDPKSDTVAALPEEMSFVSISAPNVLVSTIKKAEDDDSVVLRLVDMEGKDAVVRVDFFFEAAKSELVSIIEEEGKELPSNKNSLRLKVGHEAIETVKLWPQKMTQKQVDAELFPEKRRNP
jgi:alpha-mannosidase